MATKKAGGSTALGRDSISKRLGVKLSDGQRAIAGNIIIRQRGTKYHPGENVGHGTDDTLFALTNGTVKYSKRKKIAFNGSWHTRTYVEVVPETPSA